MTVCQCTETPIFLDWLTMMTTFTCLLMTLNVLWQLSVVQFPLSLVRDIWLEYDYEQLINIFGQLVTMV